MSDLDDMSALYAQAKALEHQAQALYGEADTKIYEATQLRRQAGRLVDKMFKDAEAKVQ